MVGITSNRGLFLTKYDMSEYQNTRQGQMKLITDIFLKQDLYWHWLYLLICFLGLIGHEFIYCFLVGVVCVWVWFVYVSVVVWPVCGCGMGVVCMWVCLLYLLICLLGHNLMP